MAGGVGAPLRELIIDRRTGRITPVWERYFTLTVVPILNTIVNGNLETIPTGFENGSIPFVKDGFLNEDNPGFTWLNNILSVIGIIKSEGRYRNKTDISNDYSVKISDEDIFIDTSLLNIEVYLLPGSESGNIKIVNTGKVGNIVNINPDGADLFFGENATFSLYDNEIIETSYSDTHGWF